MEKKDFVTEWLNTYSISMRKFGHLQLQDRPTFYMNFNNRWICTIIIQSSHVLYDVDVIYNNICIFEMNCSAYRLCFLELIWSFPSGWTLFMHRASQHEVCYLFLYKTSKVHDPSSSKVKCLYLLDYKFIQTIKLLGFIKGICTSSLVNCLFSPSAID